MLDALNRLCKWRSVLAGWHLGYRTWDQPGTRAMRDLMDKWLILRCENSALAGLLLAKGVFTAEEYSKQVQEEAAALNKDLEAVFPGFRTSDEGVVMYDLALAQDTMKRLGFPA